MNASQGMLFLWFYFKSFFFKSYYQLRNLFHQENIRKISVMCLTWRTLQKNEKEEEWKYRLERWNKTVPFWMKEYTKTGYILFLFLCYPKWWFFCGESFDGFCRFRKFCTSDWLEKQRFVVLWRKHDLISTFCLTNSCGGEHH